MKKTILIQLVLLLALGTTSFAQKIGNTIPGLKPVSNTISMNCLTHFQLGQPATGIRAIEAVRQGYRDNNGDCVFDVLLFVPLNLQPHLDPDSVKWTIDGSTVPGNNQRISVPVPDETTTVTVTYNIGNQQASASRTFLVN